MIDWHLFDSAQALEKLGVDPAKGLSSAASGQLLVSHGRNELLDRGGVSPWRILWEQFTSTLALILIAAAFLSIFVGSFKDSFTILAIVCLFALLWFIQEYRA